MTYVIALLCYMHSLRSAFVKLYWGSKLMNPWTRYWLRQLNLKHYQLCQIEFVVRSTMYILCRYSFPIDFKFHLENNNVYLKTNQKHFMLLQSLMYFNFKLWRLCNCHSRSHYIINIPTHTSNNYIMYNITNNQQLFYGFLDHKNQAKILMVVLGKQWLLDISVS